MASDARQYKDQVFEQIARVGRALSSPKRLELLDLLSQGPRTVEALAELADLSPANASQHLQVLRAARLVDAAKSGLHVTYRLGEGAEALALHLRQHARARLAELDAATRDFLAGRGALEPVDGAELLRRALAGEVTVLDVRPAEEFRAGHLPGARSIPLAELRARLCELPRGREVVACCRGPWCVFALDAVALLREAGFSATRLESGPPDWRAAGVALALGP